MKHYRYQLSTINYQLSTIIVGLLLLASSALADVKRESLHFLTTEAGVGYSALLNNSEIGQSSGFVGGKLQVGYEWRYRKLIVHTGLEFAMLSDQVKANPFALTAPYTIGLPAGLAMEQHFDFQSYSASQLMGQVNIPVQVGAVFQDRYYFLAGARIGLPVLHSSCAKANVNTYLTDPSLIGELAEVPVHDAFASEEKASLRWPANSINAQVSAEVGLILNSFFEKPGASSQRNGRSGLRQGGNNRSSAGTKNQKSKKKPVLYRLGLFCDYGVTSCTKTDEAIGLASVSEPRNIALNDYIAASNSKVNSLLVGAKFAVLFQLNEIKSPKKDKPLPSFLDIYIADAETSKPVPASLSIYDHKTKRTTVREAKKGYLHYRAKPGDYTVTASNAQYEADSQEATISGEGITETLNLALVPKPQPVVIDTPIIDIPIQVGTKVVLHRLFFATGKTQILPESEAALNELATFMNAHPALAIRITGHTDNIGSERDNQILSEGRANAVRDELLKRGIAGARIEADGKGESEPVADNATEEGRARNRRVEFTIIATGDEQIEQILE